MSKCIYCGTSAYGKITDNKHPKHVHEHSPNGSDPRCKYCGCHSHGRITDNKHPEGCHIIQ